MENNTLTKKELYRLLKTYNERKFNINLSQNNKDDLKNLLCKKLKELTQEKNKDRKNFTVYYITEKNNIIADMNCIEINPIDYISCSLSNRYLVKSSIDNFLESIDENIEKISFYIYSDKEKSKKEKFDKIFKLLKDKVNEPYDEYCKRYTFLSIELFNTSLDTLLNFSYKAFIFLFVYLSIYYSYILAGLGLADEIISTDMLYSTVKIVFVVLFNIMYSLLITILPIILELIAIAYFYRYKSCKSFNIAKLMKIFLKSIISIIIYYPIITIISERSLYKAKKDGVNVNSAIIRTYIEKSMYPRVIIDKKNSNNRYLAIYQDRKYFYYFDINKIFSNINRAQFEKDTINSDYTQLIVAILKNSSYTDTKNIILIGINKVKILDKNSSYNELNLYYKKVSKKRQ